MRPITKQLGLGPALLLVLSLHTASAYYDPGVQRWINRDPIAEEGGVNLYQYASNQPVDQVDPYGEIAPILILVCTCVLVGYFLQEGCHVEEEEHKEPVEPEKPEKPKKGPRQPPPDRIPPRGEPPPGRTPPRAPVPRPPPRTPAP